MTRFVLAVLVLALALPAAAQPRLELYLKNRSFDGRTRMIGADLYAVAEDMLRALDWSWREEGERLMVWSRPGGGPDLDARPRLLVLEGRSVQVGQESFGGSLYLRLEDLAQAAGARYRVNRELGTADYFPTPLGEGIAGPRRVTDGRGRNGSPLRLEGLSYRMEAPPGAEHPVMRGYAVVRNTSAAAVQDVLLTLEVQDAAGRPRGGSTWAVGTLKPGEEITWQFPVWTNFEDAPEPRPTLLIEHR